MTKKAEKLSIIIPVFNEARFIGRCLAAVMAADSQGLKKEVVVVDDGSTDGSWQRVRRFIRRQGGSKLAEKQAGEERWRGRIDWIVRRWRPNRGKGAAVKWGIGHSSGTVVLIQDADLEYDPSDYPALLRPILAGRADVVYGSRFIGPQPHRVLYFGHYLGNRLLTWWSNIWTGLNLSDVETGYKVFRGDLIRRLAGGLRSRGFGFEIEITARLARQSEMRIYEVGIGYWGRTYAEGKKIGWRDGFRAFWQTVWHRFF